MHRALRIGFCRLLRAAVPPNKGTSPSQEVRRSQQGAAIFANERRRSLS